MKVSQALQMNMAWITMVPNESMQIKTIQVMMNLTTQKVTMLVMMVALLIMVEIMILVPNPSISLEWMSETIHTTALTSIIYTITAMTTVVIPFDLTRIINPK